MWRGRSGDVGKLARWDQHKKAGTIMAGPHSTIMPSQQQNQLSKVIYKVCTLITHTQPDPMSTHEMIAIVNPETVRAPR